MQNNPSAAASSGDEISARNKKAAAGKGGKPVKKGRKWDADGMADEEDNVQLDYSAADTLTAATDSEAEAVGRSSAVEQVDASTWGSRSKGGQFVLRDLDGEVRSILTSAAASSAAAAAAASRPDAASSTGLLGSGLSTIGGLFRNMVGGKTLAREDLEKPMKLMEEHLLNKNVAREAAVRVCEGSREGLIGTKTGSFESGFHPLRFAVLSADGQGSWSASPLLSHTG